MDFAIFKNIKPKGRQMVLLVAASSVIGAPMTLNNEGVKLHPYYDSVGVKTWCGGETEIGYKEKFTRGECVGLFNIRYGYYSVVTTTFYNQTAQAVVTPEIHAAITDMSYNVGLPTVKKSGMIRNLNAGNPSAACHKILTYKKAGGRDCSLDKGNPKGCYGVWTRRVQMFNLCMKGVPK